MSRSRSYQRSRKGYWYRKDEQDHTELRTESRHPLKEAVPSVLPAKPSEPPRFLAGVETPGFRKSRKTGPAGRLAGLDYDLLIEIPLKLKKYKMNKKQHCALDRFFEEAKLWDDE